MSITLDVSNFLQNEIPPEALDGSNGANTGPLHTARKMEALLHKELENIAGLPKDGSANIFDEIENFLKHNKFIDPNERDDRTQQRTPDNTPTEVPKAGTVPIPALSPTLPPITISYPNLGFEQFSLPESQFLEPKSPYHQPQIEPQLYSVESGHLQPITSPFLATGIYRKMTATLEATRCETKQNVFITVLGDRGSVLSASHFHEQYICAVAYAAPPEEIRDCKKAQMTILELPEDVGEDSGSIEKQELPTVSMNCGIRVPKQWDALSKWAYDILKFSNRDHIVIDRQRNEIVRTHNATKKKTIYRFLSPEDFRLKPQQKPDLCLPQSEKPSPLTAEHPRTKFGRPPKRKALDESISEGSNTKESSKKQKKQHQQRVKQPQKPTESLDKTASEAAVRTRFGRIVRSRISASGTNIERGLDDELEVPLVENSVEFIQNFLADLKDSDFRCSKPVSSMAPSSSSKQQDEKVAISKNNSTANSSTPTKRKVPPEAVCPTCNKIFLGRRMQRHFVQYPDHMQVGATASPPIATATNRTTTPPLPQSSCQPQIIDQSNSSDLTLFRFLVAKLQRTPFSEDQRADLFLNEINDLVAQLQLRSSRLIRNTSGLHFVSARCSRVLGIPEGHYALDMAAIVNEAPPPAPIEPVEPTRAPCLLNFENLSSSALPAAPLPNARTLDYTTLSMSLDDTLTDEAAQKLNLSAGGKLLPPSEESLLRTVGDLVHDGLQKLQQESAVAVAADNLFNVPESKPALVSVLVPPGIHYEHANDNAVEAANMKEITTEQEATPLLGLPVDFFQFNND